MAATIASKHTSKSLYRYHCVFACAVQTVVALLDVRVFVILTKAVEINHLLQMTVWY